MVYVALLRGINVGGNNKINMKDLAKSFASVGMERVKTYINSGNLIFENNTMSQVEINLALEKVIKDDFALEIKVLLKSYDQYRIVIDAVPLDWTNDKEYKSDILFLWEEVDSSDCLDLLTLKEFDTLEYVPGAVLWHIDRTFQSKSGLVKLPSSPLYKQVTIRNVNTARKIWDLMNSL